MAARHRSPRPADWLAYSGFVVLRAALRALPIGAASGLGRIGGALAFYLLRTRRERTVHNLRLVLPDMGRARAKKVGRRSFERIGRRWAEQISLSHLGPEKGFEGIEVSGWEHLERAEAEGRGVLIMTGHWDAFDIASYPFGPRLGGLHIVVQPQSNPLIRRDLAKLREGGQRYLLEREGSARRMLKMLRDGKAIGLAIDQRVQPFEGILVPFLGRLAWTSPVPAILSRTNGTPVLPVFCTAVEPGRYRVEAEPPILPGDLADPDGDDAVAELTMRYLEPLERRIREDPTGWMWMTRRWQRTWRHSWPELLQRLRKDARLDELATAGVPLSEEERERSRAIAARVGEVTFLEAPQSLVLVGGDEGARRRVSRDVFRQLVEQGWPGRRFTAGELVERLRGEQPRRFERSLDTATLLLVEGLDDPLPDADRQRLLEFLVGRLPRGSVLATASRDPGISGLAPAPL